MEHNSGTYKLAATDLSNHLSCPRLTQLNRRVALGELKRPYRNDPSLEVLAKRGREHEDAFIEHLRRKNLSVVNLRNQSGNATIKAMEDGIDVIAQARLEMGNWMGYADVLIKVEGRSTFGNWSYEVYDTKLAQTTKAATILQLCLYSDALSVMQQAMPERMYVVTPVPDFIPEPYFFSEFRAYYNHVRHDLEKVVGEPIVDPYPVPVPHCDICNWWPTCNKQRHDDDYLSLVAGIRRLQIEELEQQHIKTLEAFAMTGIIEKPKRGNRESYLRKQHQAIVQLTGRKRGELIHQLLPVEEERGFNRLPEPNPGDIYFDIEGDAFYPDGGLEYILGYAFRDDAGKLMYKRHWATNRVEEKEAFQQFMKFVTERWSKFPNLNIYHFAPYEPSAVKRLASVHAVFELEVDELLRAQKFIDLHQVFKESLLASVERYSLKTLEAFTTYQRNIALEDASVARKHVECALELNEFMSLAAETKLIVEQYNEDDCLATEALHVWIEALRTKLLTAGHQFTRFVRAPDAPNEPLRNQEKRSRALYDSLVRSVPDDRTKWNDEHHAKWLLAHQIDYFRREDKTAWWEHFRLQKLEHEELLDERKAITGLKFVHQLPLRGKEKTPVQQYTYPPQEVGLSAGDTLFEVNSMTDENRIGKTIGMVDSVSQDQYLLNIKKKATTLNDHPVAVHSNERIDPGTLWTSLMDVAEKVDEDGLSHAWPYHAAKDLLMKRKPRLLDGSEGAYVVPGEEVIDAAVRIALNLNKSILPIQGPPGTGKTHTGAKMIIELAKAGKKIGITAISHRVIGTLMEKTLELAAEEGIVVRFAHKITDKLDFLPKEVEQLNDPKKIIAAIQDGKVTGGTAWLWSSNDVTDILDYLFIDEAGQMSLSQAIAASRATKNIVLLGDPQQLEQPQRGAHPEGSDVAALSYLLDGHQTMPEGKGLFLGVTRRIHPDITRFTSEMFYEGKLSAHTGLERQMIGGGTMFDGAGLFYVPVSHTANQNSSPEEAAIIAGIVDDLLSRGSWTDRHGATRRLSHSDILIVAPYNAQVATLCEKIPGVQIGTVDKFQGKEAPVVIYSLTSSTVQDAPRGMNFLFSPNRLNVATSRAKSACIIVSAPALMEPECTTIDQMRWANAFCRYLEMAQSIVYAV